jgi:hypothetical protein
MISIRSSSPSRSSASQADSSSMRCRLSSNLSYSHESVSSLVHLSSTETLPFLLCGLRKAREL